LVGIRVGYFTKGGSRCGGERGLTGRSTRTRSGIAPPGVLVCVRLVAQCHCVPVNSDVRPQMNRYSVPPEDETLNVLRLLKQGVTSVSFRKDFPSSPWPNQCQLQLADGRYVLLEAGGEDLEFKFEVFPLYARLASSVEATDASDLAFEAPVAVTLLETESWLDPAAPTGETLGTNAVSQFNGSPGSAPSTASATCRYFGGVELIGASGKRLVIATGSFPYSMHVEGVYEDQFFNRADYVRLRAEA
jgi:hypothetical protein